MEESERDEGFRVVDKRRFTPEGETREKEATRQETESERRADGEGEADARRTVHEKPSSTEEAQKSTPQEPPRPMDFSLFVVSLANTALMQLGFIKLPNAQDLPKDILAARQTIDILAMLEEKTRGNLSDEEKKLLSETLFQLRMAFVEATR